MVALPTLLDVFCVLMSSSWLGVYDENGNVRTHNKEQELFQVSLRASMVGLVYGFTDHASKEQNL